MRVKITKSIGIADKSPSIPIVNVVKGETRDDLSDHVANRLIELGWATSADKEPDTVSKGDSTISGTVTVDVETTKVNSESTDNAKKSDDNAGDKSDIGTTPETLKSQLEELALKEMDGLMGSEQKAKAALEAFGKERYSFDADKRMSVENIIDAIIEAAFKE